MSPLIEIENYTKIIKNQTILRGINLSLEPGLIHGFVGYNGSGKTMLFKGICGFIRPTEGEVRIHGKVIGVDIDFPRNAGIIIEQPNFIPEFTAFNNLKYLVKIKNCIGDEKIAAVLRRVGLDPDAKKKIRAFSLGMKQRLALAQAIMEDPELLILDEPMNALDKEGVAFARQLLLDLKAAGVTILLCSHVADDIEYLCDDVWRLDSGNIEQIK